jgi:hypothetical protein
MPLIPPVVVLACRVTGTVQRSCSLLLSGSLSAPTHEALSQKSVTNRSVHPQKHVTVALRDECSQRRAGLARIRHEGSSLNGGVARDKREERNLSDV